MNVDVFLFVCVGCFVWVCLCVVVVVFVVFFSFLGGGGLFCSELCVIEFSFLLD